MDFTNCMMKGRYIRIETAGAEEQNGRIERVRSYMKENGLDAVVDLNPNASSTGLWLTGEHLATAYVIFPEGPVLVEFAQAEELEDGTFVLPNGMPIEANPNPNIRFINNIVYPEVLKDTAKIGLVHMEGANISVSFARKLGNVLKEKEIAYITHDINRIKSIRSPLEVELNKDTGEMIDKVMKAFPSICRKGRLYKEISDEVQYLVASIGCPGDFMVVQIRACDKDGRLLTDLEVNSPGVRVEEGHNISLLLETSGPSNHYACGARQFSLGEPSEEYKKAYALAVKASRLCGELLVPGANLDSVTKTVMQFIRQSGYDTPDNHFVQSMGYSCAEDPRAHETVPLVEGMPIICHPPVYPIGGPYIRGEGVKVLTMYVVAPGGGKRIYDATDEITIL